MLLPRFNYHQPESLEEALEIMAEFGPQARALAGGTDLLVNLKAGRDEAQEVVSLHRLVEWDDLSRTEEGLRIGPLVTAARLEAEEGLGPAGVVGSAAGRLGSPLIRNRATVGGNLISARPAADLAPPLMALGALAVLESSSGQRTLPLEDFFTAPGQTRKKPEELLTAIIVPPLKGPAGGGYQKLGTRKALEIAIVNVAAVIRLNEQGFIKEARIFLGAVGPTPLRAKMAEMLLEGEKPKGPNDPVFHGAGLAAVNDSCAIDDHRGSADYRCQMVEVLTKRALAEAFSRAVEK
jgi:carbon-monoxide dehydrogenase medium subunit